MQGASREAAARAREALDAAIGEAGDAELGRLGGELFSVGDLLDDQLGLRRALADPSVPGATKSRLLYSLLLGKVDAGTLELLQSLVRARWSRAGDLVDTVDTLAASAVLAVSERAGGLDEVEDQLFRFSRIVDREPALRSALTDPSLPNDRKRALLEGLLGDRVQPTAVELIERAVLHGRGRQIEGALEDYAELAAQRRSRLLAHVRVARPLTAEQFGRLGAVLARIYGHPVMLQVEIDPDVIGGISVQVGDELIDGTVVSRLESARRGMAGD